MYAAEADGLRALRAAGVRAPEPFAHGVRDGAAFIEMERLELGATPDWRAMAHMLAALHRQVSDRFGWASDNWIGLSPQKNALGGDWPAFFRDCRLMPQIERARRSGFALEMPPLSALQAHRPQPALVHGDLWGGNVGFTAAGPVIFDPAVYYADREVDLAMTELFGGFPRAFYSAYREAFPLEPGYERRRPLYNLYHLLNHLNLFGAGYLAQVQATLRLLREAL